MVVDTLPGGLERQPRLADPARATPPTTHRGIPPNLKCRRYYSGDRKMQQVRDEAGVGPGPKENELSAGTAGHATPGAQEDVPSTSASEAASRSVEAGRTSIPSRAGRRAAAPRGTRARSKPSLAASRRRCSS